ncbi:MAG: TIGR02530 family flagellar biosynthesis protein, partial [Bdellovibrionota bacterium]
KKEAAIDKQLKQQADIKPMTLKFSNHAVERMSQRGITFSPEQFTKIENAARKASEKGSKETLIFADDSALIVSLKTNTIVTVMDKSALKENVFTNIDSTVMV